MWRDIFPSEVWENGGGTVGLPQGAFDSHPIQTGMVCHIHDLLPIRMTLHALPPVLTCHFDTFGVIESMRAGEKQAAEKCRESWPFRQQRQLSFLK